MIIVKMIKWVIFIYFPTGMTNTNVNYSETQDPFGINFGPERYHEFSRDPARTPMQWTSRRFAGNVI